MEALHRAGRRAEALDAYRTAFRRLRDDLGIQPGPELRGTARGDPGRRSRPGRPRRSPCRRAATGRARLPGTARPTWPSSPGREVTAVVAVAAGVGKSALAVRWANLGRRRLPRRAAVREPARLRRRSAAGTTGRAAVDAARSGRHRRPRRAHRGGGAVPVADRRAEAARRARRRARQRARPAAAPGRGSGHRRRPAGTSCGIWSSPGRPAGSSLGPLRQQRRARAARRGRRRGTRRAGAGGGPAAGRAGRPPSAGRAGRRRTAHPAAGLPLCSLSAETFTEVKTAISRSYDALDPPAQRVLRVRGRPPSRRGDRPGRAGRMLRLSPERAEGHLDTLVAGHLAEPTPGGPLPGAAAGPGVRGRLPDRARRPGGGDRRPAGLVSRPGRPRLPGVSSTGTPR